MSSPTVDWSARSVLVTGATGMVGSALTAVLVAKGARVVALVPDVDPQSELYRSGVVQRISVVNGRLEDVDAVERAVAGHDVDIAALVAFHESHGRLATVTTVRPLSRFGVMDLGHDGQVEQFREKPITDDYVNAGFFIFEPEVFSYLDESCVLEQGPLEALAREQQLMAYRHDGFWQPMDTFREYTMLNQMWSDDDAPWKVWE